MKSTDPTGWGCAPLAALLGLLELARLWWTRRRAWWHHERTIQGVLRIGRYRCADCGHVASCVYHDDAHEWRCGACDARRLYSARPAPPEREP